MRFTSRQLGRFPVRVNSNLSVVFPQWTLLLGPCRISYVRYVLQGFATLIIYANRWSKTTPTIITRVSPSFSIDYLDLTRKSTQEREGQGLEKERLEGSDLYGALLDEGLARAIATQGVSYTDFLMLLTKITCAFSGLSQPLTQDSPPRALLAPVPQSNSSYSGIQLPPASAHPSLILQSSST